MYPGTGPVPNWSWDRLKFYIYRDQYGYNEKPIHGPGFKDTAGKHLPKGVRIPDWRKYSTKGLPELVDVEERLAARGLKNPWLRNEAWRFNRRLWGTSMDRWLFMFRYIKYGVAGFVVCEAIAHLTGRRGPHVHKEDKYTMVYELQPQKH